jgi:hypothetical protein
MISSVFRLVHHSMDLFIGKLGEFLEKKTEVVRAQVQQESEETMKTKEELAKEGLTYDMNKFLKGVREFEAERAKKSKKRIKDYEDM